MTLEELLEFCRTKNWNKLLEFQNSNVSNLSTKLLISAVITAHHQDKQIIHQHGLAIWSQKLSADPVSPISAMLSGAVDLSDFVNAYVLARSESLKDLRTAQVISKFVRTHKYQLGQYLSSDQISQQQKDLISKIFTDIAISKKQKEEYFKKTWAQRDQKYITFIQSVEQAKIEFSRITELKFSDFALSFSFPSDIRGVRVFNFGEGGDISFKESIPTKKIKDIEKTLKSRGIHAHFFNLPVRGMQISQNPQEFVNILTEMKHEKENAKTSVLDIPDSFEEEEINFPISIPLVTDDLKKSEAPKREEPEDCEFKTLFYSYVAGSIDFKEMNEKTGKVIKQSIQHNKPQKIEQFFGKNAHKNFLTSFQLQSLNQKQDKENPTNPELYQYFNTIFLKLCIGYACKKGCLDIVKYFIEKQRMQCNFDITLSEDAQKLLSLDELLLGSPIKLAAIGGKLDVVKYIYEHTDIMIEKTMGHDTKPTILMETIKAGHTEIVKYLLEHGADPNAGGFESFNDNCLRIAIQNKRPDMISVLIAAGAIVTHKEVLEAIRMNLDNATIDRLMNNSIDRENPYRPYLLAAIESGNIALLNFLEKNPLVKKYDEIALFHEDSIEKRMLLSAAQSNNVEMMRFLVTDKHCDLQKYLE